MDWKKDSSGSVVHSIPIGTARFMVLLPSGFPLTPNVCRFRCSFPSWSTAWGTRCWFREKNVLWLFRPDMTDMVDRASKSYFLSFPPTVYTKRNKNKTENVALSLTPIFCGQNSQLGLESLHIIFFVLFCQPYFQLWSNFYIYPSRKEREFPD